MIEASSHQCLWLKRYLTCSSPMTGNPKILQKFGNPQPFQSGSPATSSLATARGDNPPTPVQSKQLEKWLEGYRPDLANKLVLAFRYCFDVDFNNLKSALDDPTVVDDTINKELSFQRLIGPFKQLPFSTFRVSPLGQVPPTDKRKFHHVSHPEGSSINDGIPAERT